MDNIRDLFAAKFIVNGKYNHHRWLSEPEFRQLVEDTPLGDLTTFKEKVYGLITGNWYRPGCGTCGGPTKLLTTTKGFNKFCSKKCSAVSADTVAARKATNLALFGVANPFSSATVQEKIKRTVQERYGVDHAASAQVVKDTARHNNMVKYGVSNPAKLDAVQSKIKQTNLQRYGVAHASAAQVVKDKVKQTSMDRYGVASTLAAPSTRDKIKQTTLERHGVNHNMQSPLIKSKAQATNLARYRSQVLPARLELLQTLNITPVGWGIADYTSQDVAYRFYHAGCGREYTGSFHDGTVPVCPYCRSGRSTIEVKLFTSLQEVFPDAISNSRTHIPPKEIDIVIGSVGVEVNGVYWHQAELERTTLLDKTKMFNAIPGHQLLHFWDYELLHKFDICRSMILAKLGKFERRVVARKCSLKVLTSAEAREFFTANHLQGHRPASYYLGLQHEGEIVMALSIGKQRYGSGDLELYRLASRVGTHVVGGAARLLKQVRHDYAGHVLLTYADKRYSVGAVYRGLGFTELVDSSPGYLWVKGTSVLTRHQTQRHRLEKLFNEKIPAGVSEATVMAHQGYVKIRDCGNKVFTLHL